jgi:hypothetical protein
MRVSVAPTADMLRQGQRLNQMKFEERTATILAEEMWYYGWPEESKHQSRSEENQTKKFCSPACRRLIDHNSTRFWLLSCTTIPLLVMCPFHHFLKNSKLTSGHWLILAICCSLSICSQLTQMYFGNPTKVIDSQGVWRLTRSRHKD